MTKWHSDWQARYPDEMREAVIGLHRADVRLPNGNVIEFQHSPISVEDIHQREQHYGRMIWVFDATEAVDGERLLLRAKRGEHNSFRSFRWLHPRRSLRACRKPVYLDVGQGRLLALRRLSHSAPYGGWGVLLPVQEFVTGTLRESALV